MKGKFLPFVIAAGILFGMLSLQIGFDIMGSRAQTLSLDDNRVKFYEDLFKNLTFTYSDGSKVELAKLKEPLVLVNFWATWCTPCLKEFSALKKLESELGSSKFKIVGVNCDNEGEKQAIQRKVASIMEKNKMSFKSVIDTENKYLDEFKVNTIPASFIFAKGKLIYFSSEYTDFTDSKLIRLLRSKI